jgi:hypothetical protein
MQQRVLPEPAFQARAPRNPRDSLGPLGDNPQWEDIMSIVKRSTALQGRAVAPWWLFWLTPILGASAAGFFYSWLLAA